MLTWLETRAVEIGRAHADDKRIYGKAGAKEQNAQRKAVTARIEYQPASFTGQSACKCPGRCRFGYQIHPAAYGPSAPVTGIRPASSLSCMSGVKVWIGFPCFRSSTRAKESSGETVL